MFLLLTDLSNNLVLVNTDKIDAIELCKDKAYRKEVVIKICISSGYFFLVQETVSEISLLLQAAGKCL